MILLCRPLAFLLSPAPFLFDLSLFPLDGVGIQIYD